MSFLSDLLASTRARVERAKGAGAEARLESLLAEAAAPRSLRAALSGPDPAIVAEIKRATPSAGPLRLDLDPARLASAYAEGGAAAISVLTEPEYFLGSLDDLRAASGARLPVLLKDFVIDRSQILEARAAGADSVLLIVRILGDELADLLGLATSLGMEALVEVFDDADVDRAIAAGASLVGINHRDLETFEVDPERTGKIAPRIPDGITVVALSGVSTRAEVLRLASDGADAVLVGEALVTASDPAAKLRELLGT